MQRHLLSILTSVALALAAVEPRAAEAATLPASPAVADALELTVDAAVDRAVRSGEELRLAQTVTREASGRVREAFSAALPQISGSIGYTRQIASVYESFAADSGLASVFQNSPFGAVNRWTAEITASQRLFSGGKIGAGIRAANAVRQSAHAQENEAALDVAFQVKRAYYEAAYATRLAEIAAGNLEQSRLQLTQIEKKERQGMTAEYDLLRARVDAANQEPPAVWARNNAVLAMLELKRLANVPLEQPVVLASPLGFAQDLVPVVASSDTAIASRPALVAAEADVRARYQLLKVQQGYRWPDLSISTTLQQQAFPSNRIPELDQFRRNWEASVKLEIPIFTGLRTEGQIERARAEHERARVQLAQLRESVRLEAARARAELERAGTLLAARRETVGQARRAGEIAGVRFTNGLSTQLEVSDSRLQLQTAQANEAQATRDYLVALAQLERALGRTLATERRPLDHLSAQLRPPGEKP